MKKLVCILLVFVPSVLLWAENKCEFVDVIDFEECYKIFILSTDPNELIKFKETKRERMSIERFSFRQKIYKECKMGNDNSYITRAFDDNMFHPEDNFSSLLRLFHDRLHGKQINFEEELKKNKNRFPKFFVLPEIKVETKNKDVGAFMEDYIKRLGTSINFCGIIEAEEGKNKGKKIIFGKLRYNLLFGNTGVKVIDFKKDIYSTCIQRVINKQASENFKCPPKTKAILIINKKR